MEYRLTPTGPARLQQRPPQHQGFAIMGRQDSGIPVQTAYPGQPITMRTQPFGQTRDSPPAFASPHPARFPLPQGAPVQVVSYRPPTSEGPQRIIVFPAPGRIPPNRFEDLSLQPHQGQPRPHTAGNGQSAPRYALPPATTRYQDPCDRCSPRLVPISGDPFEAPRSDGPYLGAPQKFVRVERSQDGLNARTPGKSPEYTF